MKTYLLRYALLMALLFPIWLLVRRPRRPWPLREKALTLFVLLFGGLLCLVLDGQWQAPPQMLQAAFHRLQTGEKIQLTPLLTIRRMLRYGTEEEILINLWGNVVMFVPFGFFLPLLWERFRHPLLLAVCALLLPLCIECCQLFIGRMTDIDDILLNFLGVMLGGGLFALLQRSFPALVQRVAQK